MKPIRRVAIAVVLCALLPAPATPQALTSLASLRVGYNTRKATVRPEGELKAQIDAIDMELAEATRFGRTAEIRRLLAKGTTLLSGRPWTDVLEFSNSLVLRSDRVVVDSTKPYAVRLEQIYSPSIQLERSLTARVALRKRTTPAPAATPQPGEILRDLGAMDGVGRDLRDSPFRMELDLRDVPDGTYQLAVDLFDEVRALGSTALTVSIRKGLDELVGRLESDASRAREDVRADILFPVDRMQNVNRGRLELRTFDPDRDFPAAEAIAAAVKAGKHPFAGRTGDFKRHYLLTFDGTASAPSAGDTKGEIMPYRMYVPASYAASRPHPLIVALHGLGGTEDSFFAGYEGTLPRLAEQHGYIVVAPLGYRVDGSYGWGLGNPPADLNTRTAQERSEQDVMQVLQLVTKQYKIDESRIYLMGHSMGAIGTWKIAPKFPNVWAALGPIAGSGSPATLDRIRHIPQIVVHGDADPTVNVQGSRSMVAKMRELGIEVKYIEVPGGGHSNVVAPNLPAIIEFFNTHRREIKN
jgi:poly(3-hydroxybutyrate) depolymerase